MIRMIPKAILLSATALTLVAAPILLNQSGLTDISAYAANNGKGKSEGNGKSDKSDKSDKSEKSSNKSSEKSKGSKKVASTVDERVAAKPEKAKNLNAQLGRLNSLNRNINGLMNSSSKNMALVREYVQAGADLQAASDELLLAQGDLDLAEAALDQVVLDATVGLVAYDGTDVYAAPTLESLNDRLAVLNDPVLTDLTDPAAQAELDALVAALDAIDASPEAVAVADQQAIVDDLQAVVDGLTDATSEESLREALLAAANANRVEAAGGDAYLTPEIMDWATVRIDALTDAYIAQQ